MVGGRAVSDLLPELVSVHERADPRVVEAEKAPQGCQNVGRKWLVEGLDVGRDCRVIDWFTRLEVCHLLGKPDLCATDRLRRPCRCGSPIAAVAFLVLVFPDAGCGMSARIGLGMRRKRGAMGAGASSSCWRSRRSTCSVRTSTTSEASSSS